MGYNFGQWDSDEGIMQAGSIYRVSSSDNKIWGEENLTEKTLLAGTFVAVNSDGGIKMIESSDEIIHGIIVRDIYGDKSRKNRQLNIGHFSHGDSVVALSVDGIGLQRGNKVYIVAGGDNAGKITNVAEGNIDLGYWVERVSNGNNCAAITLGYVQSVKTVTEGAEQ
ncbi:MAG: hypothetical protein [Caudoviricetes sp.]|nr:MAG: hypothetical protein [Caudoviricetes sp.]